MFTGISALGKAINLPDFAEWTNYIINKSLEQRCYSNNWLLSLVLDNDDKENIRQVDELEKEYNIRYLGELLERYDDKGLDSIKSFRALAMSLAVTTFWQDDYMFVGKQKADFIRCIQTKYAKTFDVYLAIALHLLQPNNTKVEDDILKHEYKSVEQIIFACLMLRDDSLSETLLESNLNSMIPMLSFKRQLSISRDIVMYRELIKRLTPMVKNSKRKELAFYKALCILPFKRITKNKSMFKALLNHGMSELDILYLNYRIPHKQYIVSVYDKPTWTKIACDFAAGCLLSEAKLKSYEKELLDLVFRNYDTLKPKFEGFESLDDYLIHYVDEIKCNNTYLWAISHLSLPASLISFDILAPEKIEIIENLDSVRLGGHIKLYLSRLADEEKLKGTDVFHYLKTVLNIDFVKEVADGNYPELLYHMLRLNIISLSKIKPEVAQMDDKYKKAIAAYTKNYFNRSVYEYIKAFLKQHSIPEFSTAFSTTLSDIFRWDSVETSFLQQDLLQNDELLNIIFWIETELYYEDFQNYISFIVFLLKASEVEQFIDFKDRRNMFLSIENYLSEDIKDNLRQKYLTDQERAQKAAIEKEIKDKEEAEERATLRGKQEEILKTEYEHDLNGFSNYRSDIYKISSTPLEKQICYELLWDMLEAWLKTQAYISDKVFKEVAGLAHTIYNSNFISPEDYCGLIQCGVKLIAEEADYVEH